ncbi:3'(2'),5'-bisphosphate nucleotidase CysQ [Pseudahrensia aquimaris]|uniref:3'(2'),5'-bisphosphate nucleotidase CysQ n=1 Tax=Pseudahrensia aquimaris TaxID=744461 RepID=A0ABW3FFR5_9HYPH
MTHDPARSRHSNILKDLFPIMREAGRVIAEIYREGTEAEIKDDGSPVTRADKAANAIIEKGLAAIAPEIRIISEETPENHDLPPADAFFIVDPLDGTKEFLRTDGTGEFTVNIALIEHGTPVLGAIYAPMLDQLFAGVVGEGAALSTGGSTHVIEARERPAGGGVAMVSRSHRDAQTDDWLAQHHKGSAATIGSSLKFCLIAQGKADLYSRFSSIMEWDTAAGDAILRAAGGHMMASDGTALRYGKPGYRNGAFIATGASGWPLT